MRIGIVGSRKYTNCSFIRKVFLSTLTKNNIPLNGVVIVSGGASGVDECAQKIAKEFGLTITIHYPNWKKYGRKAGPIRNKKIVDDSDIIIAFPSGNSVGTWNTIHLAKKASKKVIIIRVD